MLHKIEKVLCILVLMGLPLLGQVDSEMPLRQKRLSDKVLLVWAGDHLQTIATVAVTTKKGIWRRPNICISRPWKSIPILEQQGGDWSSCKKIKRRSRTRR